MKVDELRAYLNENWITLKQSVMDGKFRPNPARRVEILKEDGIKKRKLGIPTTVDRVIQQAIAQVLSPMYEVRFSDTVMDLDQNEVRIKPCVNANSISKKGITTK